ncbi:TetR/AcrR family transcriptional regulator [Salinicoccus sp. Marseille-QA3877]
MSNGVSLTSIVDTAAKVFAEKGYRKSTLNDVASQLGVSKPALYYYVKNKYQILWMIFDEIMDHYIESAEEAIKKFETPEEKLRMLVKSHASAVMNNKSLNVIFYHEQKELNGEDSKILNERMNTYTKMFVDVYNEGKEKGIFKDQDGYVTVMGIISMINGIYQWYHEGGRLSKQEIIDIYINNLEDGYKK